MEMEMVGTEAVKVLSWLKSSELKPDEKVAVLEAAANIIRATLNAEMLRVLFHNVLAGGNR